MSKPTRKIALALAALVAGFIVLLATRSPISNDRPSTLLIAKMAPEITGRSIIDGRQVSLTSLRTQNKYVLVNFFGSYCIPCIKEHPDLVKIDKNLAEDVTILGVMFEENVDDARDFFKQRGGNWPVVDSPRTAVDYGVVKIPESFLISPSGVVLFKASGGITEKNFKEILDQAKGAA